MRRGRERKDVIEERAGVEEFRVMGKVLGVGS